MHNNPLASSENACRALDSGHKGCSPLRHAPVLDFDVEELQLRSKRRGFLVREFEFVDLGARQHGNKHRGLAGHVLDVVVKPIAAPRSRRRCQTTRRGGKPEKVHGNPGKWS